MPTQSSCGHHVSASGFLYIRKKTKEVNVVVHLLKVLRRTSLLILVASISIYFGYGHIVHIEAVITLPQTIRVWIHVVAVVNPKHFQGNDALVKVIRLHPKRMPTTMIKTQSTNEQCLKDYQLNINRHS